MMKKLVFVAWTILSVLIFWRSNVVAPDEPALAALQQVCAVFCVVLGLLSIRR